VFDSHCHLTAEQFAPDLNATLLRARTAGVTGIVSIASNAADARAAHALATSHDDVWSTAGIHPHEAAAAVGADRSAVLELCTLPRVVALGETGLDYFYDSSPRDVQRDLFTWHLQCAADTGLPVVVHSRAAEEDTAALLRDAGADIRGVLHCFAAGALLFDTAMDLGWYISFGGMATFRNFNGAAFLQAVPADRLLIETDAPYLAPVPMRGKRNEPAWLAHTCAAIAELRSQPSTELGRVTAENARRFYRIENGA
jgi:TatD DNase family protein